MWYWGVRQWSPGIFFMYFPTKRGAFQNLVIQSDLFGMVKWPFQGLSDLQLGDEKGTLNHLEPKKIPQNHDGLFIFI